MQLHDFMIKYLFTIEMEVNIRIYGKYFFLVKKEIEEQGLREMFRFSDCELDSRGATSNRR